MTSTLFASLCIIAPAASPIMHIRSTSSPSTIEDRRPSRPLGGGGSRVSGARVFQHDSSCFACRSSVALLCSSQYIRIRIRASVAQASRSPVPTSRPIIAIGQHLLESCSIYSLASHFHTRHTLSLAELTCPPHHSTCDQSAPLHTQVLPSNPNHTSINQEEDPEDVCGFHFARRSDLPMLAALLVGLTLGAATTARTALVTHLYPAAFTPPRTRVPVLAAKKAKKPKKVAKKAPAARGFGAKVPAAAADDALVAQCKKLAKIAKASPDDPRPWVEMASAAANCEEYAEARMLLEAGIQHCGSDTRAGETLAGALGQMRRVGSSPDVEAETALTNWPGKGDESPYDPSSHTFRRFSTPAWPSDSPRGSSYPTGHGSVCVSETPILDPEECAWVLEQADQSVAAAWSVDHANSANIGVDKIWDKPFPDRLWLRDVPGLLDWFEHRLRTRLFPMLQSLYPEAIPDPESLRCHDAFISRYDAKGMRVSWCQTGEEYRLMSN